MNLYLLIPSAILCVLLFVDSVGSTHNNPYGNIDAFDAYPLDPVNPNERRTTPIKSNEIFVFNNVNLNLRRGYDTRTGKFTVRIPGIYHIAVYSFSEYEAAKLDLYIDRKHAFGEEHLCSAHSSGDRWRAAVTPSCARLVELQVGDEVYPKGHIRSSGNGKMYAPSGFEHAGFKGFLLYPKNEESEI